MIMYFKSSPAAAVECSSEQALDSAIHFKVLFCYVLFCGSFSL